MFRRSKQFNRFRAAVAFMMIAASILGIFVVRSPDKLERLLRGGSTSSLIREKFEAGEMQESSQGTENGSRGGESEEMLRAMTEFAEARTAPSGIVNPGAYSSAVSQLNGLSTLGGAWSEVTKVKYDADDPDYRDYYSNSSGGSGNVTGRITGLAADGAGNVYAASAAGGVWRSTTGGGNWTPIADALPSLSSGDLELNPTDGSLWYATGEANTGSTSYVGSGVYRLANSVTGKFSTTDRVGGSELESTTINSLRFANGRVWAATLRGIWYHSSTTTSGPWTLAYAPNPGYLPASLQQYSTTQTGFGTISTSSTTNAPYKNIVNDVVVDPKDPNHILAAIGWRSGDTYNGFYESRDNGVQWTKINPQGGLDGTDVGYVNFAFSSDGSKLYAINQSPRKLNSLGAIPNTYLDGVYVSPTGSLTGPWNKIASSDKLGSTASGSALYANFGQGYSPGIQSWYNQFIIVDPANANHVYVGLEEVYETKDGGTTWKTVGPYWNFYFSCWAPDALYNSDTGQGTRCPLTTHSDQHAVAIGAVNGKQYVFVGNDGGAYRRPLNGTVNANGNATDWKSLNDGTIDALQYYAVGIGRTTAESNARPDLQAGDNVLVSGGLQDNGGSLLRPGAPKMVSNFGGDGGDVLVDPNNGCNIVQEYVYLSMEVTWTCANPGNKDAFLDKSKATTVDISPPDINAQFIAPFTANETNINQWLAAGNSLWYQDKGFAIRSGSEWRNVYTLGASNQTFTAVSYSGNTAIATWCGPCSNSTSATFKRGAVVGKFDGTNWTWTPVSFAADFPNRFLQGTAINPNNENDMFVVVNGFSRRFSEGPGAGLGHVFESKDGGVHWTDISANFPDIPSNDILALKSGGLVVGTDLGVVYRAPGATSWSRLGP